MSTTVEIPSPREWDKIKQGVAQAAQGLPSVSAWLDHVAAVHPVIAEAVDGIWTGRDGKAVQMLRGGRHQTRRWLARQACRVQLRQLGNTPTYPLVIDGERNSVTTTTATGTRFYQPALCQPASALPARLSDWVIEPKLDGIRLQIVARDGEVHVYSRAGLVYDGRLPEVEAALSALDVVVDGEVVWFDPESGLPDFHKSSGLFRREDSATRQRFEGPLTLVAFDLLEVAGQDIRRLPIETRRQLLAQLVEGLACPQLRLIEQTDASPEAQSDFIRRYREGIVLKKRASAYPSGRTPAWLKLKQVQDADVVVMRAERGEGKYSATTGCVAFGQFRDGTLVERGTCSGMTDRERDDIWQHQERYIGRVLTIRHMGLLPGSEAFRHPQWQGMRDDKVAEDCLWDE